MAAIRSSISCNLDENLLAAALPLLEAEKVEAIEWSFDALFKVRDIPGWFVELLQAFASEGRLTGHGVYFSLFSGNWSAEQEGWLRHLQKMSRNFRFDHVSEHFGFMTGKNFHQGAPLPIPFTKTTLAIGRDRLTRIYEACQCPVGLENLAFSYSLDEVKRHGIFLDQLVDPVNGFIILDLHNLYCQCHNFNISAETLLKLYPLQRVREIHVSGGSWQDSLHVPGRKIRRDTHDGCVPAEVFDLLLACMPICPNLKYVVLEQLSNALVSEEQRVSFRHDFLQMKKIVEVYNHASGESANNDFLPKHAFIATSPVVSASLFAEQRALSAILENAVDYDDGRQLLSDSPLANTAWEIEKWEPSMLETAISIARKWKDGFT
jgi:uncharacterized protein (UPF0276 family)